MKENIEYQIFIGGQDPHVFDEIVSHDNLKDMVVDFFRRKKIDFTVFSAKGGYISETGRYVSENTLCINIIGADNLNIIKLAKSLAMFMNQEHPLVVKNIVKAKFS